MKKFLFSLVLTGLLPPAQSLAQTKAPASAKGKAATAASKIEPLRALSGVMRENRITVSRSAWINPGKQLFEYRLASARIVDGRLEFVGSYQAAGKAKAEVVAATLVSTLARSANPWPGASSATARERRSAAQNQPRERGEVNEQTQSLYSAAEPGSGCEVIYLRLQPPGQNQPLQVGVTLAHLDNEAGNQINQAVCRLARALSAKEKTDEALSELNRLISRE